MSAITYHTCCNYAWEETTVHSRRCIKEQSSQEEYLSGDSNWVLRGKFITLSVGTPTLIALAKIVSRTLLLITGSWWFSGKEKAEWVWIKDCRLWQAEANPSLPAPEKHKAESIKQELIDQIIKLVTLPFALIALTFVALWGLISPLEGRKLYSDLEICWSIALPKGFRDLQQPYNYFAYCMQPVSTWEKENFYYRHGMYHGTWHDFYSRLLQLKTAEILDTPVAERLLGWKEKISAIKDAPYIFAVDALQAKAAQLKEKLPSIYKLDQVKQPKVINSDEAVPPEKLAEYAGDLRRYEIALITHLLKNLVANGHEINQEITSLQDSPRLAELRATQDKSVASLDLLLN